MNQEEQLNDSIEKLSAQLELLRKKQTYLATKRKEAEVAKANACKVGFYAAKTCNECRSVIEMSLKLLDIDNQAPSEIIDAFQRINSNSYRAIKALERDAAERGEE